MPSDPVTARSSAFFKFISRYMRRYMRRNFHAVRISKAGPARLPLGRPAIVYCNHPAWWDPALLMVLADTFFADRPGYGPMESAALAKYGFMRRIGLFGVEPGTRHGAAQFLRTGLSILKHPDAMLWVTAEGAFTDARARPVRLQPGVAALMRRSQNVLCVPLAIEYPFWNERYPEALCRFGEPLTADAIKKDRHILRTRLTETMDYLAAQAMARDPRQFDTILKGAVGIGGVYDLWRQLKAIVRGRRFTPAHSDSDTRQ